MITLLAVMLFLAVVIAWGWLLIEAAWEYKNPFVRYGLILFLIAALLIFFGLTFLAALEPFCFGNKEGILPSFLFRK